MPDVTVKQLAEVVGTPVDKLLEQLVDAGIKKSGGNEVVSDDEKMQLLDSLRASHGKDKDSVEKKKITLSRKRTGTVKLSGAGKKTVSVEVRGKRTYIRRGAPAKEETEKVETAQNEREQEEAREQQEELQRKEADAREQEAEREKIEQSKRNEEEAKLAAMQEAAKMAEEEVQRLKAEAEAVATAAAEAQKQAAEQSRLQAESAKTEARGGKSRAGKARSTPDQATRYGRNELHVSKEKSGKRKKKGRTARRSISSTLETRHVFEKPTERVVRDVSVPETISVSELAGKMAVKVGEVIKTMMGMGVMATINQILDQDTATLVVEEMGHNAIAQIDNEAEVALAEKVASSASGEEVPRPPVVTVMGHVDHGKTSLLDYIRSTHVTSGEAGGITQHIGAYHVETGKGMITFLDTPGHAAFTAMRARGAKSTDIVILVVAADDGVMPQTVEAIQHSAAAKVPMIIAVNKMDKPEADPDRVKNGLASHKIIPEEWGGDHMFVHVSAQTGEGIDDLLDAVLLQSELLELKAMPTGPAHGVVIEATLDKGRGPVATVLVQQGQLRKGDIMICGSKYGRVRALFDENSLPLEVAGPSIPVAVLGLSSTPDAGDEMLVAADERDARELAALRQDRLRDVRLASRKPGKLEDVFSTMGDAVARTLNVVVKTDVQGSFEAMRDALERLSNDEISVRIIGGGVGGITESDVNLATASDAILIGFNVRAESSARKVINEQEVNLHYHSVIYDVIDYVKSVAGGMLAPEVKEKIIGLAQVKDVFRSPKFGAVAGSIVVDGVVRRSAPIRVLRDNIVIYEGELESLRRFKDDVNDVRMGTECGIAVKNYNDVQVGDQIEVFERTEVARTL